MTLWLSAGLIFTFTAIAFILLRWGNLRCEGTNPVPTLTFIAILFTSGLDVGLIMFPLTEFGTYANTTENPEYAFANPLAIEFGFWGFLIWGFYFLTCFYFCRIEPQVKFFELAPVKIVNNMVIIGTCAFTAYLLLANLPWYVPQLAETDYAGLAYLAIVLLVIAFAVSSSMELRYVRILSLSSAAMFACLIALLFGNTLANGAAPSDLIATSALISDYFASLHKFILPINDYHEFYLYWWFAWSIMIGQFTARFVGGLRTWQLLIAMMVVPSIPIAAWFTALYYHHTNAIEVTGAISWAMVFVGVIFVVNSLDSLIRLYTDNLGLTVRRLGAARYWIGNFLAMTALTIAFQADFLEIEWVGALVIGTYFACFGYLLTAKRIDLRQN